MSTLSEIKQWLKQTEHYCAYQERSHSEVRFKLIELGARGDTLEEIIANLIENNYLNEERFATAYVSGKFRIKHWGKIKIKQGLKLKQVSNGLIKQALAQISDDEYIDTLTRIITQKSNTLSEENPLRKRQKTIEYAQNKGFELPLILQILQKSN